MSSRWFNVAVVLLWLGSMGWLISTRVMPALLLGEPPNYQTILDARQDEPAVAWQMGWQNRQMGWALSNTQELPTGMTEVHSLVRFDDLPLGEMAPGWLRPMLRGDGLSDFHLANVDLDSILVFDPLGHLSRFESALRFQPGEDAIKVTGTIDSGVLALTFRAGEVRYESQMPISQKSMLGDAFSPETRLPGLREGQAWTIEVFSPLRPASDPLEVIQARVERMERIAWQDELVDVWLVVYRKSTGAGLARDLPQAKLWVRTDGMVLKQQVSFLGAEMVFVRLPEDRAAEIADRVEKERAKRDRQTRPRTSADADQNADDSPGAARI